MKKSLKQKKVSVAETFFIVKSDLENFRTYHPYHPHYTLKYK